jgi:hypothetical protein
LLGKDLETNNEISDPFLSKGSVNTLPRKRDAHDNTVTVETGEFSTWSVPRSKNKTVGAIEYIFYIHTYILRTFNNI